MKLYVYDHCPYCVKARMIFGLKDVAVEVVELLNDDEKTPIEMIGKKMLPILEKQVGQYVPESLDIIATIDQTASHGKSIVHTAPESEELNQWLKESRQYTYALAMPRWVAMGLGEFKTQSAIDYFTHKKYDSIGPFEQNLFITQDLINFAQNHLQRLEDLYQDGEYFWGDKLTWDDFHVFATLRCLTTVKGLEFPKNLDAYMNRLSEKSEVPLHWNKSLGKDLK